MPTEKQYERLHRVNELIKTISSLDRRFFYCKSKDRIASFEFSDKGKLFFIDDYTGERVYPYRKVHYGRARGFSHGGTLWSIVNWFREFIITGEKLNHMIDFEETWAYSYESTMKIREKAVDLGILNNSNYPYRRF